MTDKFCKDCAHYHIGSFSHVFGADCSRDAITELDPVTGSAGLWGMMTCKSERADYGDCGPDGQFWQARG